MLGAIIGDMVLIRYELNGDDETDHTIDLANYAVVQTTVIEEDVTAVHIGEPVMEFNLPVSAVSHVYGSGKEYLGEALV